MPQDFNTMTPGSAVADQLQDILTKKRNDARQAMIDEINRKNMESEMSYRAEQAASSKEQREAHAQEYQAAAQARAAALADQAKRADNMKVLQSNLAKDPKFLENMSPLERWMTINQAMDQKENPPADMFTPMVPEPVYDEVTNSWQKLPGAPLIKQGTGSHATHTRPPQPTDSFMPVGFVPTPTGGFSAVFADRKNPRNMISQPVGEISPDPRHATNVPPLVDRNLVITYGKSNSAQRARMVGALVNSIHDPDLSRDINHVIQSDPDKKIPLQTIMSNLVPPDKLNPNYFKQPQDYTNNLRNILTDMGYK